MAVADSGEPRPFWDDSQRSSGHYNLAAKLPVGRSHRTEVPFEHALAERRSRMVKNPRVWLCCVLVAAAFHLSLATFSTAAFAQEAVAPAASETASETPPAAAEEATSETPEAAAPVPPPLNNGDQAWMLMSCALVLFMTPGLAFFYGGLVRRKNVLSVLMQCFFCMCIVTVLWVVVGFSLAFGSDVAGGFIGNPFDYFMLKGVTTTEPWEPMPGVWWPISEQVFMIFQAMFAIITPGLIVGAFAERMKFSAFVTFLTAWVLLVYCPVAHWVWYGALGIGAFDPADAVPIGALDFAGGTVVHINAGIAALICCFVLGKRADVPPGGVAPHNLPFAVLGAGMLWFGWFGFNAGSAGGATPQAVQAFVVTQVAAAAAGLVWSAIEWLMHGRPTMLGMITGAVAGLVAITPAAGFVEVGPALIIGGVASLICFFFVAAVKPMVGYDDALDVFGVHGIGGVWGAVATGLFALPGVAYGNMPQLIIQVKAIGITVVYSAVVTFAILMVIKVIMGLRTSDEGERLGLDVTDHALPAYNEA
jgi:ammonium transporter, Amt family